MVKIGKKNVHIHSIKDITTYTYSFCAYSLIVLIENKGNIFTVLLQRNFSKYKIKHKCI